MKKFFVLTMLVIASVTVWAQQQFTPQEQELIDLSNQKWAWMSEKNADKLAELFHENAMFVHMGGSWGKEQEVGIIRGGMIWYKKADIHSQEVKFVEGNAIVYSNIHLTSEVGGNEVCFPFMVSEVFVKKVQSSESHESSLSNGRVVKDEGEAKEDQWKLGALIFTRLMEPGRE